ncbi:MAG TPA: glycoside hydrolase family 15 protein [Steroidobacteraceae bacterium]|jgi:GH15 family glucan-1,4-alpha-glucosidase
MPAAIEDYALIGDCETAALVGRDGSIDWLCWPRFDSDACFAALLGNEDHGRWLLAPVGPVLRSSRQYRKHTLILETRHETETGAVVVIDFMPPRGAASDVVRLIRCERGSVCMRAELVVRFGYGASVPWVTRIAANTWQAIAGPDMVIWRTSFPMRGENLRSVGDFVIEAGQTHFFSLTYGPSHLPVPNAIDVEAALRDTEHSWVKWSAKGRHSGRWSEAVTRSLITLRALIYNPTGGMVAAPTTSLPEQLGGERNWDYRFCWLRDATLTLLALMNAGYYEEAKAWRDWLLRAVAGRPTQMQIMYGVAGERRLSEWEVSWLPGYQKAKPVRIGNAAHGQLQLDVFGELMDALYQARQGGLDSLDAAWEIQCELLKYLETAWEQPDYGIWEVRGDPRHFTYSKVMVWVAFDRAVKSVERFSVEGPVDHWRELRHRIHEQICRRGYDSRGNTFVQAYDCEEVDASLLLLPAVGFLPVDDSRVLGTIAAVEKHLLRDGFVMRYDTQAVEDGLPPGEGAFLACSFWLADVYAMCGRTAEASALFERLLALANDVGLLAEEYDVRKGRLVGNFPQAFSHLSLVGTAFNLSHSAKPAEQRSDNAVAIPSADRSQR